MSDPRIYHRVGPVAPEGRQIYDEVNRQNANLLKDLGLVEGEITLLDGSVTTLTGSVNALDSSVTTLDSSVTTLETSVSDLESDVAALACTPVQVGTGVLAGKVTGIASGTSAGDGASLSSVTVTPSVAKPFVLVITGGLGIELSGAGSARLRIYETTAGAVHSGSEVIIGYPYGTDIIPTMNNESLWNDAPQHLIGLGDQQLVANTATSARTFELWFFFSSGSADAQHAGSIDAFQWTVG